MPEILTESFCERCGTRYTFQSVAPKVGRLAKMKVLSRGLKNYVLSDETSLDEALADARSVDDRQQSVEQLDAFHKTFNFCMSCRQYTCANCWNEREGKCLSCAPFLGQAPVAGAIPGLNPVSGIGGAIGNGNGHAHGPENGFAAVPPDGTAWPNADVRAGAADVVDPTISRLEALFGREGTPRPTAPTPPEPEATVEAAEFEAEAAQPLEGEPVAVDAAEVDTEAFAAAEANEIAAAQAEIAEAVAQASDEPDVAAPRSVEALIEAIQPAAAEPVAAIAPEAAEAESAAPAFDDTDEIAAAATAQTHSYLDRFRARPITPAEPVTRTPAEPVAAVSPVPAPTPAPFIPAAPPTPAYEPMAAVAPTPEPPAPAAIPPYVQPLAPAPYLPPPAASPAPSWRMVAPETPVAPPVSNGHALPSQPVGQPSRQPDRAEPAWPTVPAWPAPLPRSSRGNGADVVWAESTRDLLSRPDAGVQAGVQACLNCGLALSATARFCRRCGANQVRA